jgi:hypothetical protein
MEDEGRMDAPNEPDAPMKSDASSCFVVSRGQRSAAAAPSSNASRAARSRI